MKKIAKPTLENLDPGFGYSFRVKQYADPCRDKKPYWHFHPEMEMVYIEGGSGKRHIGNHVSYFQGGDLILIGSNLPHYGFTDRLTGNKSETIIQMREDFLGEQFMNLPEMAHVSRLLEKSKRGVAFHGETKEKVGAMIRSMVDLDPFKRLLVLLEVLKTLAMSKEQTTLNVNGPILEVQVEDNDRMKNIYKYVRENYKETIPLHMIADEVSMTEPAFCRYFKKMSGKTFTQFVNEYRLVHASKLLAETSISISEACFESGFNNFSHFNKQFKNYTGKSPSQYRKEIEVVVPSISIKTKRTFCNIK